MIFRSLPDRMRSPQGRLCASKALCDLGRRNLDEILAAVEKELIRDALQKAGGVKAEATRILKISRYSLIRRMKRL